MSGTKIFFMGEPILKLDYDDIQALSIKYFGDELVRKEMEDVDRICHPSSWARVDDGGYEGALGQLISAIVSIIGLTRVNRRHE